MTTKIDWTKPIETTDGRPAKVLPYEPKCNSTRFVVVDYRYSESLYIVRDNGCDDRDNEPLIRNVRREPQDIFVNEYLNGHHHGSNTKEDAHVRAGEDALRVAVHYREVIEEET